MSLFGLDPQSIAARVRASGRSPHVPSAGESLLRGALGFTALGLAGFAPWAMGLGRQLGEGGMYAACALAFIALSGPLLHRLITGPGSLTRCYKLFASAFLTYAVLWSAVWFGLRFKGNDYAGLVLGLAAFGAIMACAFDAKHAALKSILALIGLHALGYFLGGLAYADIGTRPELKLFGVALAKAQRATLARLLWGLFYGLGFGAGLGLAFHFCQERARALLAGPSSHEQAR
ncbi:MAG: hypothetical protein HY301_17920 [Verrucomicrobia bacterium]|nr:hypothetical protein [Verrucomicrobiota bacterium]